MRDHRRLDGLIASFTLLPLKMALAVGGATATYLLAVYGYRSGGVPQTEETVSGILLIFTVVPAMGFILAGLLIERMKLSSKVVIKNAERLQALRTNT